VRSALRPGIAILDVGAGAAPCVSPPDRPPGCTYVGLDISRRELLRAPLGSYDATVVADASELVPELAGRFDLIVSWFAFEHIAPLAAGVSNIREYLAPCGRLISNLSGAFSIASILNRLLPQRAANRVVTRLFAREPGTVFPARYDRCWHSALERLFTRGWAHAEIVPIYVGARYFQFSRLLSALYLCYEEWAVQTDRRNLAPYYLVDAVADDPPGRAA
jgi:SAM-dependent methyltransferase